MERALRRRRAAAAWTTLALLLGLGAAAGVTASLLLREGRPRPAAPLAALPMQGEPLTMVWAWESPADLSTLDPARAGVAFLAREVVVGKTVTVRPRRQPLRVAPGAWLMAVVRIEAAPGADLDRLRPQLLDAILNAIPAAVPAAVPTPRTGGTAGIRALQIDFDATASQQRPYARLLRALRQRLDPALPLGMTALVSWCGAPGGLFGRSSWLAALRPPGRGLGGRLAGPRAGAIAEAVPMFFRMGGPAATRATSPRSTDGITEPLCAGSVGVALDEAWPALHSGQRVYIFPSGGRWTTAAIAAVNANRLPELRR